MIVPLGTHRSATSKTTRFAGDLVNSSPLLTGRLGDHVGRMPSPADISPRRTNQAEKGETR
jgi:hypothetical protein